MTDLDRSINRVRTALFLFGVPFAASLAALTFRSTVTQVFPIRPEVFEIVTATTAIGLLAAMLLGWIADRRALRAQGRELEEQARELSLKLQELDAHQTQHALELKLKQQELEKEIAVREERVKVRELEHEIKLSELTLKRLEDGDVSTDIPPASADAVPPSNAGEAEL